LSIDIWEKVVFCDKLTYCEMNFGVFTQEKMAFFFPKTPIVLCSLKRKYMNEFQCPLILKNFFRIGETIFGDLTTMIFT